MKKNPDFRFNRMRKSGKTKFFEVHIESALITHLITALFFTFRTFSAACTHIQLNIFITHVKYLFFEFRDKFNRTSTMDDKKDFMENLMFIEQPANPKK